MKNHAQPIAFASFPKKFQFEFPCSWRDYPLLFKLINGNTDHTSTLGESFISLYQSTTDGMTLNLDILIGSCSFSRSSWEDLALTRSEKRENLAYLISITIAVRSRTGGDNGSGGNRER